MLLLQGSRQASHGRGDGPHYRDRARAVCRVRAGGIPGRDHGPALQAVCDHDRDLRDDFRICRPHAQSGPLRPGAEAGRRGGSTQRLFPALQQAFRLDEGPLYRGRRTGHQAGGAGTGGLWRRDRSRLRTAQSATGQLPAGGGPGLLYYHRPASRRRFPATDHRGDEQA